MEVSSVAASSDDASGAGGMPAERGEQATARAALLPGRVARVDLLDRDRVGFPAVHVDTTYAAPLRYGDTFTIRLDVVHLGQTSCTLRHHFERGDRVHVATVAHTVVCCALREPGGPRKLPFPPDVRRLLEEHLAPPADRREGKVTR